MNYIKKDLIQLKFKVKFIYLAVQCPDRDVRHGNYFAADPGTVCRTPTRT